MVPIPICTHTISVRAPMKCGVAFMPSLRVSSSTILPMEYHRADLSRWAGTTGISYGLSMRGKMWNGMGGEVIPRLVR